jgi:hypothetical protein
MKALAAAMTLALAALAAVGPAAATPLVAPSCFCRARHAHGNVSGQISKPCKLEATSSKRLGARSPSVCRVATQNWRMIMKKLVTTIALASSLAALAAAVPAAAATARHHHPVRSYEAPAAGPGDYEGDYEWQTDENDRASSPYAGGVG